jgi:hypothetical protein
MKLPPPCAQGWINTSRVILRLLKGWELYDDHGTWRWYDGSLTEPGFDDELPTEDEIALIQSIKDGEF